MARVRDRNRGSPAAVKSRKWASCLLPTRQPLDGLPVLAIGGAVIDGCAIVLVP
jgi:hypothetical protein